MATLGYHNFLLFCFILHFLVVVVEEGVFHKNVGPSGVHAGAHGAMELSQGQHNSY